MRAVGYFVEGAERNGVVRPIADQNRDFLDFCSEHGYDVASTFVDAGNGREDSGYRQLLAYLELAPHGFMAVLVDSVRALDDDLGRIAVKLLAIEQAGARVISLHTRREAVHDLVELWGAAATGEAPISEKIKTAMRRKAVRGDALGRPPYGYRIGPDQRLEIVPEEAGVVRMIFEMYLKEGLGIRRIAGELNEQGLRTRRGGRWRMVSIRDILRNRAYLGTYSRFGVRVSGTHPPLATPDEFRAVQRRLEARAPAQRERKLQPFLLSGMVTCGRCGNRLIGVSRRQKWTTKSGEERSKVYRYYQCESRTNQNRCGYNTQRADDLEERVRRVVAGQEPPSTRLAHTGNAVAFIEDTEAEIRRNEGRQRRIRRRIEELVADAASGTITVERFRDAGAELASTERSISASIDAARDRLKTHHSEEERRESLRQTRKRLATAWNTLDIDQRRDMLRSVIDDVVVDDEDVRVYLRV
jgi:DNA invertase Pin-like site-specific DNA recombinase